MKIESINPATGAQIDAFESYSESKVEALIENCQTAFTHWRTTHIDYRGNLLKEVALLLEERKEALADMMTREMGKITAEAISEVEKCAWVCRYYADHAAHFLADETINTDGSKSYKTYQPIGVVLAVMPWNFPLWQVFRFAAPTLMAGNTALLKHASNVPECALAIEDIFQTAGLPEHLFRTLLIPGKQVNSVIQNRNVQAVTLTGSGPAGSAVAAEAGKLFKKTVLELGGSDPYLILEDADLAKAAEICANSRLLNAGQSCIGAKRFIVLEAVYDEFLKQFKQQMDVPFGDPKTTTGIGPMAREDLRDELHQQVQDSISAGAKCSLGGQIPHQQGAFYPPTILEDVAPGMPAYHEELFGPVASIIRATDEEHAIELANDSIFGLGAAVFTEDLERGERIAKLHLEAGACFVNGMVKSDPRLPFGGIKTSGYGRELSAEGIREFTNIKTVWVG